MANLKDNLKIEDSFAKYNSYLYRFALSILKNEDDANDVSQETWIRVCRHINSYDQKKGASYKSWLGTICKRLSLDVIRKRHSHHYFNHIRTSVSFYEDGSKVGVMGQKIFHKETQEKYAIYNETKTEIEKLLNGNSQYIELFRGLLDGHTARSFHLKTGKNEHTIKSHIVKMRKIIRRHYNSDLIAIQP